jgi:hypothetical protein
MIKVFGIKIALSVRSNAGCNDVVSFLIQRVGDV